MQKNALRHNDIVPLIIITNIVKESCMNQAIEQLSALDSLHGSIKRIRIELLE